MCGVVLVNFVNSLLFLDSAFSHFVDLLIIMLA